MKIAVAGCGAVGSFYGAKLARAGHQVHFLLRSDFDTVRRHGVFIESPDGDFHVQPVCARDPAEIGPADLVLVALKATANHRFPDLIPPLAGPHTAVVTLQNGLGNEEALAKIVPPDQVLGGLCFVCLNRVAPGRIRHMDHGLVVLGEFQRPPGTRLQEIAAAFAAAGIPCRTSDNLHRAHWEKLVWNVPFNGLGVAAAAGHAPWIDPLAPVQLRDSCFATDRLLRDSDWESRARQLMLEVIRTANALKLPVDESLANTQIERTRSMGAYQASTLIDFELGRPLELEALFLEPLRRARSAGMKVPFLERLCKILSELDSIRKSTRED
ncbi:MAG: 2-dehydropantoate 2-reductase [Verrucomicrobiota bacterium]